MPPSIRIRLGIGRFSSRTRRYRRVTASRMLAKSSFCRVEAELRFALAAAPAVAGEGLDVLELSLGVASVVMLVRESAAGEWGARLAPSLAVGMELPLRSSPRMMNLR